MIKALILKALAILICSAALITLIFFIYKYTSSQNQSVNWSQIIPVTSAPVSVNLDISQPDDETLVFDQNLLISGKTSPKAVVLISVEDTDIVTTADSDGSFSRQVGLTSGLNHITIYAFDQSGNSKSATRTIYYSQEKI